MSETTSKLQIELFGGLRIVRQNGSPVVLAGQQPGALLAYLALNPGRSHTREELADFLWPDEDMEEARAKLRKLLYAVRAQLEEVGIPADSVLIANRSTIQLGSAVASDVAAFEEAISIAIQSANPEDRARFFKHAIGLYRGALLPGYYQDCFVAEQNRLSEAYHSALHELTLAYEQIGDFDRALEVARRAVAVNVLNEEAHCDLMRLYAAKGQPSAVLRQYQELERILRAELEEEPSEAASQLMETLRSSGYSALAARLPSSKQPSSFGYRPPASNGKERRPSPQVQRYLSLIGAVASGILLFWILSGFKSSGSARKATKGAPVPGSFTWIARVDPMPGDKSSEPTAIMSAEKNDVIVAGMVNTEKHDVDFLTRRYGKNGRLIWEARYNGPSNDVDRARCLAPGNEDAVYVAGESDNGKGNGETRLSGVDVALIKYDRNGKPSASWPDVGSGVGVRRYNGPANGEDWPVRLLTVEDGSVYVLCKTMGKTASTSKCHWEIALIKYGADGNQRWVHRFSNPAGDSTPCGMERDGGGNIYIAGTSRANPSSGPETDYIAIKVSSEGREVWRRRWGENNQSDDAAQSMHVDKGGTMTIAGTGRGLPGTPDANRTGLVIVRFDSRGDLLSVRGATQDGDRVDPRICRMQAFSDGSSLIAGAAVDKKGRGVLRTVLRDPSGLPRWTTDVSCSIGVEGVRDCNLGPNGAYVLVQASTSSKRIADMVLVRIDIQGNLIWQHSYGQAQEEEKSGVLARDYFDRPIAAFQSANDKRREIVTATYNH